MFGYGRHKYTFENRCKEEGKLLLGDETTKIFLNANGIKNDVGPRLKAVLDYIAGRENKDGFVMELEKAVREAKHNREWRHEYMTLMMRDQENIEKGIKQGRDEGLDTGIRGMVSVLKEMNVSDEEIIKKLKEKFSLDDEKAKKYL